MLQTTLLFLALVGAGPAPDEAPDRDNGAARPPSRIRLTELQSIYDQILPELEKGRRPAAADQLMMLLFATPADPLPGWYAAGRSRYDWTWLAARFDTNRDTLVTRKEYSGSDAAWARLDRDHDGVISRDDMDWSETSLWMRNHTLARLSFRAMDTNGDGQLTEAEWSSFYRQLAHGSASVDLDAYRDVMLPLTDTSYKVPATTPQRINRIRGLLNGDHGATIEGPELGTVAPDFTLKTQDGKDAVTLSGFRGKKPVVLTFGSFTCGAYRTQFGEIDQLQKRYGDRVEFVGVYVREAHAADGASSERNRRAGIEVKQPTSNEERAAVAVRFCSVFKPGFPIVVDEIDDRVGLTYQGMPNRLYLLDRDGRVAYRSGPGPVGFRAGELEQAIVLLLDDAAARSEVGARVPVLQNDEAWAALPKTIRGAGTPLPVWARALARSLPRTTAAMLNLDLVQRTRSPLGPVLRAKMRWVAADANGCDYSRAYALADLRRAGLNEAALETLLTNPDRLPEPERRALAFARQMTLDAGEVTDKEVAYLKSTFGDEKLAAMILLLAYANFQDRILLSLNVSVEPEGPLPPLDVVFDAEAPAPAVPRRVLPDPAQAPAVALRVDDPEWSALGFDDLRKGLNDQRERICRIAIPSMEDLRKRVPEYLGQRADIPTEWGRVCLGYQPELASAWTGCMQAYRAEANLDPVFQDSLFWVVTRTIHCFY